MIRRLCLLAIVLFELGAPRRGQHVLAFLPSVGGPSIRPSSSSCKYWYPQSDNSNSRLPLISTRLYENKLWDRLGIEEDEEPYWYLINCVATNELDLLRQCRVITQDMKVDAIKFVVPLERKTRSHGANRMVTEEKVKYPGYVFAKLRLCPHVYEAVQSLDLCRSWMGNVNHKGYKKLPPVPIALNELEVENFGLEDIEELPEDNDALLEEGEDAEGIIVDSEEEYEDDPMYRGIDKEALQQFKGLKVADMVKVITKGKFNNEDGIVRRLKDGRIFVRFYTYGTLFEEWLDPGDVRKLTAEEVRKGLGGPSQPITQQDLDGPNLSSDGLGTDRPRSLRQSLSGTTRGGFDGLQRNRRQDRIANGYNRGGNTREEQPREERNWNWYKQQNQNQQQETFADQDWQLRPGSRDSDRNSVDDWAQSDVDSQWGRKPPKRPMQRDNRRTQQHQKDNRQTAAAIDGAGDWSAFVTSSPRSTTGSRASSSEETEASDFFSSLMTDLDKDLSTSSGGQQQAGPKSTTSYKDKSAEDDFFASLMTELVVDDEPSSSRYYSNSGSTPKKDSKRSKPMGPGAETGQDDDFFASLEAELGTALDGSETSGSSPRKTSISDEAEDFFAQLETELSTSLAEEVLPPSAPVESPTRTSSNAGQRSSYDAKELGKKTIPDLKELLRNQGLKVSGKKAELVDRLLSTQ